MAELIKLLVFIILYVTSCSGWVPDLRPHCGEAGPAQGQVLERDHPTGRPSTISRQAVHNQGSIPSLLPMITLYLAMKYCCMYTVVYRTRALLCTWHELYAYTVQYKYNSTCIDSIVKKILQKYTVSNVDCIYIDVSYFKV